jgi:hypothetical protein
VVFQAHERASDAAMNSVCELIINYTLSKLGPFQPTVVVSKGGLYDPDVAVFKLPLGEP